MCQETGYDENIRKCVANVQEFSVNLDTDDEEGLDSNDIKRLKD
jgi:hypothetical protein